MPSRVVTLHLAIISLSFIIALVRYFSYTQVCSCSKKYKTINYGHVCGLVFGDSKSTRSQQAGVQQLGDGGGDSEVIRREKPAGSLGITELWAGGGRSTEARVTEGGNS